MKIYVFNKKQFLFLHGMLKMHSLSALGLRCHQQRYHLWAGKVYQQLETHSPNGGVANSDRVCL